MRWTTLFSGILVTLSCSATAIAQDLASDIEGFKPREPTAKEKEDDRIAASTNAWKRNPIALELHLAPFGSPVGLLGGTVDYSVQTCFSAFAGLGIGGGGAQGALGVRFRLPISNHWALGYSPSLSGGPYEELSFNFGGSDMHRRSDFAFWTTHELSIEYRATYGFLLRLYGGASYLLNPGSLYSENTSLGTKEPYTTRQSSLPVAGLATGYSF